MSSTLDFDGLFKQAYASNLLNLVPEQAVLVREVKFRKAAQMLGDQYNQPVVLRRENGFTYAGPNAGAFNLNPPISMKTKNALVPGWQIVERCALDYETFYKADNVNSFRNALDLVMENSMESFNFRLEAGLLYGASANGLGGFSTSPTKPTATTNVITFTAAQWAVGIWSEAEGAEIDVFDASNVVANTVGAMTVIAVDVATKSITVSGAAADATAIDALTAGYVRFRGAAGNEAVGLDAQLSNTGVLFGIDAAQYTLWKSNVVTSVAKTMQGINGVVALLQGRGLNEDVDVLLSPAVWNTIMTDQAALRMFDSSYDSSKLENGAKSVTFYSQSGKLTLRSHTYVKDGEAFVGPLSRMCRIGATETTFNIPGTQDGRVFQQIPGQAGFEFRVYSNQSLLVETPAKFAKVVWA